MAKKTIHHMDFSTLVGVNKAVVSLTGETHQYSPADKKKLEALVAEVESRADNQDFEEAVREKAALLVYKVASGQYFHAGNKRTALVAGLAFLKKNGYKVDLNNPELVSTVDKIGMAAAGLDDLVGVLGGLIEKSPADRKGWEKAVEGVVSSNEAALTKMSS